MQVAGLAAAVQRCARLAKEEWRENGRGAQQPERAGKRLPGRASPDSRGKNLACMCPSVQLSQLLRPGWPT